MSHMLSVFWTFLCMSVLSSLCCTSLIAFEPHHADGYVWGHTHTHKEGLDLFYLCSCSLDGSLAIIALFQFCVFLFFAEKLNPEPQACWADTLPLSYVSSFLKFNLDTRSCCCPGWPQTCVSSASAFWVAGITECAIMPSITLFLIACNLFYT